MLITGEASSEADRSALTAIAKGVENVNNVLNETTVIGASSLSSRSNDLLIAGKIKAKLIDTQDLITNSLYVVVERGSVYLMGRVTEREAGRAADIIRSVGGVQKVVRVFEIISEEELERIAPKPTPAK